MINVDARLLVFYVSTHGVLQGDPNIERISIKIISDYTNQHSHRSHIAERSCANLSVNEHQKWVPRQPMMRVCVCARVTFPRNLFKMRFCAVYGGMVHQL